MAVHVKELDKLNTNMENALTCIGMDNHEALDSERIKPLIGYLSVKQQLLNVNQVSNMSDFS